MIERHTQRPSPLIQTTALRELLDSSEAAVLDVRWRLERSNGHDEYRAGHVPGAIFVDLPSQLAGHATPATGRHPLPDIADLQQLLRSWGVSRERTVVVYDDWNSQSAARAWWLLSAAGIEDVRVLDGGLSAWIAAGGPLATTGVAGTGIASTGSLPLPSRITLNGYRHPILDMDDTARLAAEGILFDARAGERYRGESEPIDPVAGHIPGAINAPTSENVDDTGRFLAPEALRERFEKLGVTDTANIGVYCGSGVTASHEILALTVAGYNAALYPGSWSQWSNHPQRPVAVGPEPG